MDLTLSTQQETVVSFALTGSGSLNLIARAGCGKTSTLLAVTKALIAAATGRISIFIGAYNKAIAAEISGKLTKAGVEDWKQDAAGRWVAPLATASTMHSAGFKAWKKIAPKVVVDEKKLQSILDNLAKVEPSKAERIEEYRAFVTKVVSLAKQRAFGVLTAIRDISKWYELVEHFGLDEELPEKFDIETALKFAIWLYNRSLEACKEVVDYDDMILAPLYFNARMFTYDFVFIDEAQDTNPARRALAKKMMKPVTGRLIAVGDPAQAIYGFTGADADSMPILAKELGSVELPLTVTYRCPKAVVKLAQTWVPDMIAHETAPEGVVRSLPLTVEDKSKQPSLMTTETLTKEDVILCRNTKPLVELAYSFIRRGTACQIEGRDIAAGLVAIINKWKVVKLDALAKAVAGWRDREVSKFMAKNMEAKADRVTDQANTIICLTEKFLSEGSKSNVSDLIGFIKSIFGDTPEGEKPRVLTLCTVHKSKGREWKRVYLLGRRKYMPSKFARKEWQIEQERNLMYVAVTRAMSELIEVEVTT